MVSVSTSPETGAQDHSVVTDTQKNQHCHHKGFASQSDNSSQCLCPFVTQTKGVTSWAQWIGHACRKSLVCWLHPLQSQHDPRARAGTVHALMALATSVKTRRLGLWRAPWLVSRICIEAGKDETQQVCPCSVRVLGHRLHSTATGVHPLLRGGCLTNVALTGLWQKNTTGQRASQHIHSSLRSPITALRPGSHYL